MHWSEFRRFQEAVEAGKEAAQQAVHRLRALALRKGEKGMVGADLRVCPKTRKKQW
jgi:hypothetical protein